MRGFFKKWPRFYYFIATVFGPMMYGGLSAKKFNRHYPSGGLKLNLGSGPMVISPDVTNVDIFPYQGVEIVADISSLPLPDNSASRIICDTVLEHVISPPAVVKEIKRVLIAGGYAYITVPFLYPFHLSPDDYFRWTKSGLLKLLEDFEMVEIGVRAGPFSALSVHLGYIFASIFSFGSSKLYWTLLDFFIIIFFPIKLPDIFFCRLPNIINVSSIIYCVIKKR